MPRPSRAASAALLLIPCLLAGCGSTGGSATTTSSSSASSQRAHPTRHRPTGIGSLRLVDHRRLPAPVQLPAGTAAGGAMILAAGLSSADTSTDAVTVISPSAITPAPSLPTAIHDAAAAAIGTHAYVIGGGEPSHAEIRAIGAGVTPGLAGQLPTPASDVAAASLGGAIYTVGGYDGASFLNSITRWDGHGTAQTVGRLPAGVRYAAVAAAGEQILIIGGTTTGGASRAVLAFTPASGAVRQIATLPHPLTHASAATLGQFVYVFGGRGADQGTQTSAILGLDPATGRIRSAGRLPAPLSDTAAARVGGRILLAGGRTASGSVSDGVLSFGAA